MLQFINRNQYDVVDEWDSCCHLLESFWFSSRCFNVPIEVMADSWILQKNPRKYSSAKPSLYKKDILIQKHAFRSFVQLCLFRDFFNFLSKTNSLGPCRLLVFLYSCNVLVISLRDGLLGRYVDGQLQSKLLQHYRTDVGCHYLLSTFVAQRI